MIISASRRTDIPAFFSDWFLRRLQEKQVYVRNPMNCHQVSLIDLSEDVVDCIVFWSKNPAPMLKNLSRLDPYLYLFQFTLNAYGPGPEPGIPPLEDRISVFRHLSERIGKDRVIWRYDPVLITGTYTVSWHIRQFCLLAEALAPWTDTCVFSFLDLYAGISGALKRHGIREPDPEEQRILAEHFSSAAHSLGLEINTCAEAGDFSEFHIGHGACIDRDRISRLLGCSLKAEKDRGQRAGCQCVSSIDIGMYGTCPAGCIYCYASGNPSRTCRKGVACGGTSPLLCGDLTAEDRITVRKMKSLKDPQISLFSLPPFRREE